MARVRRAIGKLQRSLPDQPLWFGRYTGITLGSTTPPPRGKSERVAEVAAELRGLDQEYQDLVDAGASRDDLGLFPNPRHNEMLVRWDMAASPPDLLVTNYSMLNAMLMRHHENGMFDQTRRWLEADANHVFTLVVDELHLYRGTQGSEVAMIVRNLVSRLGLDLDSAQLRVMGTSASLTDDEAGHAYLEQFFGIPADSFFVTAGQPATIPPLSPLTRTDVLERSSKDIAGW